MCIIGIHDGHGAAACLLEDGRITAAVQEERLTRIKNHDTFPSQAAHWVLEQGGLSWSDIDAVAMNGLHQPIHRDRTALIHATRWAGSRAPLPTLRRSLRALPPVLSAWRSMHRRRREAEVQAAGIDLSKIVYIEHHRCHAEAAYWGSPFRNEPVLVLTGDGSGDDLCATVNTSDEHGHLTRLAAVGETHSPALIYLAVTTLLGMVPNEHEYKLMGMAPYASAKSSEAVARILDEMLQWDPAHPLMWRRRWGIPNAYYCYEWLKRRLDLHRFDAICGGLQLWTERLLTEWVRRAIQVTGLHKVVLAGGIFMNVKANQAIAQLPEVKDLWIFPSCGDETNTMGAAYAVYHELAPADAPPIEPVRTVYWGPEASPAEMEQALQASGEAFTWHRPADIASHAAQALARGEVVARFDGQAEFGARALGNRSILANPSIPGVVRQINDMIKSRDFWMPFACSILAERAGDYLVNPKGLSAPYMILTFDTTAIHDQIAAGLHPNDWTVRPQVVEESWNPAYHRLIKAFEECTGIGALLNTSFNLHGYPIVHTPAEALDVMARSGLKYMILGPYWVEKTI